MEEWAKVVLPVILTGLMASIYGLYSDVAGIKEHQAGSEVYIYRLRQVELEVDAIKNPGKLRSEGADQY